MRIRGVDLTDHLSREATKADVQQADLILGMSREHVRDAAALAPAALPRAFTLKELVRRGESIGPRRPDEPLQAWLDRAAAGRQAADLYGASLDDDVLDPIGSPIHHYESVAAEVETLIDRLVPLAWPARQAGEPHLSEAPAPTP
jgi:protein-tyrosine phosphatase